MSFIGNTPTTQLFTSSSQQFSGDGSTTSFTLDRGVYSVNDIEVLVNNVQQDPFSAYTVSATTLTFTGAPSLGSGNITVIYRSYVTTSIVPVDSSVTTAKMASNITLTGNTTTSNLIVTGNVTGNLTVTGNTTTSNLTVTGNTTTGNLTATGNVTVSTSVAVTRNVSTSNIIVSNLTTTSNLLVTGNTTTGNLTATGVATFSTGSAALPSITTAGDPDTGIYFPSANTIGFTRGGIEVGRFDSNSANANFQFNSGYGSVATAYGCRAWVNFNGGSTVAIRASGNVSSITDNGTGDYTVNFTTALSDANYALDVCTGADTTNGSVGYQNSLTGPTTAACRIATRLLNTTPAPAVDRDLVMAMFFR